MYFHVVFLLHSAVQEFWHLPVQTGSQVMTSLPHKVTKKILNKKHPRCKSQKKNNSDTKLSLSQLFHDVLKVHIF